VAWLLIGALRMYQRRVSPRLAVRCRFKPSCSHYAAVAVERHGALRGMILASLRVARCNATTKGGEDLPPPFADPVELMRRARDVL
jgi:putative membrane protein insertion efficiency factor